MESRFWKFVDKRGDDECWPWTGDTYRQGYGRLGHGGKQEGAHRISHRLFNGPTPPAMHVRHACDNPICVNPAHLSIGTAADNMRDREERGRGNQRCPRGEGNPNNKLTESAAREIKYADETGKALAVRFGISPCTVSAIRNGRIWTHV